MIITFFHELLILLDVADAEAGFFSPTRLHTDCTLKKIWKAGFLRLLLVGGILWMLLILFALLFHVWSCQSSLSFFSGLLLSLPILPIFTIYIYTQES